MVINGEDVFVIIGEFNKYIKDGFPGLYDFKLDMLYSGIDYLFFFNERVSKIKVLAFSHFVKMTHLPKCIHKVVRLEF